MDDFDRDVYCIGGLPFDAVTLDEALNRLRQAAAARTQCFLSTPNLNFLIAAQADPAFRDSVVHSDLSVADGMPVVWIARLLKIPIRQRVAGSTLFDALRARSDRPMSVYFFGGGDGVAEAACRVLDVARGGMLGAGWWSPGFGDLESMSGDDTIDAINASNADFLVVSLGARKGQSWIMKNRLRLSVPIISHLGAVINFVAGSVTRAPGWMQRVGFEWLWRIKEEPSLWRRYWTDALGLARLLFGAVLPHACWLRWQDAVGARKRAGRIVLAGPLGEVTRLVVDGDIPAEVDGRSRDALRAAALSGRSVLIDVSEARVLSPAFFGLLLMLKKKLDSVGEVLEVIGADRRIRRLFRWNGVDYLIDRVVAVGALNDDR